ncbi:1-deoxy-D-xylulose-5-phosphate reductoisomerase [Marinomonas sp. 15G1-11]|uniref:1-deoxy-D-xylulose 5-phosphate reductoisomerase n=1 Tax=Marinomonas phaeophyticola TaxID=3004091 RepID=A0ABT4JU13_9GAMM|nr:1-deoxy-D-xylulose-5-phosphate reductoisomerase [Marinomonas sp. 15G1-11]MCZ2721706.1 1-deoxy-D-xylulose-5-phosphate reductoisomerase [Marinomonas sp. 15G1-11]
MKQSICLLGATGSIGDSTLDVIRQHPEKYSLFAVAANTNVDKMVHICRTFRPAVAVMGSAEARDELVRRCEGLNIEFEWGEEAMCAIASAAEVDQVMAAIMGFAGLMPTLSAIRAKKRILLANKESLVTAGKLFMDEIARFNVTLMPIDSEHNAIFQCLPQNENGFSKSHVSKLLLTASGGPFKDWSLADMREVTPAQACNHPNWSMGQKISVDSASLMNKGLELIEACWLFDMSPHDIDVVVHPQSIVHSMVSYKDGSVIAQMGVPDMKVPIAYGMSWPNRITTGVAQLNLMDVATLEFSKPDLERFPNLKLAADAWFIGGTAMAHLNAANEVAVDAFLNNRIGFLDISKINERVLNELPTLAVTNLERVFEGDRIARNLAETIVQSGKYL